MGSDRTDKPFNYKAAKCVLHCNNCITMVLALALIVSGALNEIGGSEAVLKYTLCAKLQKVGGTRAARNGMANGDMLHANSSAADSSPESAAQQSAAAKALAAAEALCRPSGEDGAAGHCKPWATADDGHSACAIGFYCDEDFVCWDCDYVTPTASNPEPPPCDAYDAGTWLTALLFIVPPTTGVLPPLGLIFGRTGLCVARRSKVRPVYCGRNA